MPRAPRLLIARFSALGDIVMMQPLITMLRREYGENATVDIVCLARCRPPNCFQGLTWCTPWNAARVKCWMRCANVNSITRSTCTGRFGPVRWRQIDRRLLRGQTSLEPMVLDTRLAPRTCRAISSTAAWMCFALSMCPKPAPSLGEPRHGERTVWTGPIADALKGRKARGQFGVIPTGQAPLRAVVVEATIAHSEDRQQTVVLWAARPSGQRSEQLAAQHPHVTGAGQWDLAQTAHAISMAKAVVTGDTVTMHLAAATGRPTLAVWGCTRPVLGLAGWHAHPESIDVPQRHVPSKAMLEARRDVRTHAPKDPIHPDRCSQKVDPEVSAWLGRILV